MGGVGKVGYRVRDGEGIGYRLLYGGNGENS